MYRQRLSRLKQWDVLWCLFLHHQRSAAHYFILPQVFNEVHANHFCLEGTCILCSHPSQKDLIKCFVPVMSCLRTCLRRAFHLLQPKPIRSASIVYQWRQLQRLADNASVVMVTTGIFKSHLYPYNKTSISSNGTTKEQDTGHGGTFQLGKGLNEGSWRRNTKWKQRCAFTINWFWAMPLRDTICGQTCTEINNFMSEWELVTDDSSF